MFLYEVDTLNDHSAFLAILLSYVYILLLLPLPSLHLKLSLLTRTTSNFTQSKWLWRLSPTGTSNTHIEFVYSIKPSSVAFIKSVATKPASRLCNEPLARPAGVRNHLPRTHPCRLVAATSVEDDATSQSSAPFSYFKSISLPKGSAIHRWL